MEIIETKVYEFDELSEEAKESAREWYRSGNDYYFLSEQMDEKLHELLKKNKIKCDNPKINYSLSYCQGDGAMFEGTIKWKSYTATIKQSGHYYHYNSKDISTLESIKTGKYASDEVEQEFEELYVKICKELANYGYECIEYENSDASVDETIRANGYTFTETGTRF
jgi:hypothetical protein